MDFGTMMKKVKSKQYKSKREFKDDLELIWSNCYTYNAEVRRLSQAKYDATSSDSRITRCDIPSSASE